jgi:hypothetical protein
VFSAQSDVAGNGQKQNALFVKRKGKPNLTIKIFHHQHFYYSFKTFYSYYFAYYNLKKRKKPEKTRL